VVDSTIGYPICKTFSLVLGNVIHLNIAHKALPKYLLEVWETLFVALCTLRSEASFSSQPNIGGIRKERHSLSLWNVIEGLFQVTPSRVLCILRKSFAVAF
jgi:hypothetical protein